MSITIILDAEPPAPNPRDYDRLFVAEMEPTDRRPWCRMEGDEDRIRTCKLALLPAINPVPQPTPVYRATSSNFATSSK